MGNNDINNFDKGRKIAEDISSVMLGEKQPDCERVKDWAENNKCAKRVVDKFSDGEKLSDMMSNFENKKEEAIARLSFEIRRRRTARKRVSRFALTVSAAAVLFMSFYILNKERIDETKERVYAAVEKQELTVSKPVLIVSDGTEIDLTGKNQSNVKEIVLQCTVNAQSKNKEIKWNKIVMPEKYTHNVVLEDGTTVYLNANSTLEYPSSFNSDSREVKLSGEAFFDVASDSEKPFIVSVGDASVKVYGTRFNVNSYDSKYIKTSLVSGSVGMSLKGKEEIMICPSEMVTMNMSNGNKKIGHFNVNKYDAWLEGYFRCDNESISLFLEDIARWYNVEFDYEFEESKNIKVSASISRETNIDKLIELLEVTSGAKFSKKGGNKYTVR